MTIPHDTLWQTKLHARLHDPAEKALVLLRDPEGHEGGSSRALHRLLGFQRIDAANIDPDNDEVLHRALFKQGIPAAMYQTVKRADWWAAAADRPQWPMQEITVPTRKGEQKTLKVAPGSQVRWAKEPVLIHPLTGAEYHLGGLRDTELDDLKSRCFEHTAALMHQRRPDGEVDWTRTLFALWRFGPELSEAQDNGTLGALWPLLPADTRVPDHSIWDHLDLTSAFAGCLCRRPAGRGGAADALHRAGAELHRRRAQHLGPVGRLAPAGPAGLGGHEAGVRGARPGRHPVPAPARRAAGGCLAARRPGAARPAVRRRPLDRQGHRRQPAVRRRAAQPLRGAGAGLPGA
jgi:hypothetical protein